jgi:hypothetical protein
MEDGATTSQPLGKTVNAHGLSTRQLGVPTTAYCHCFFIQLQVYNLTTFKTAFRAIEVKYCDFFSFNIFEGMDRKLLE